jgi:hypothetical protein
MMKSFVVLFPEMVILQTSPLSQTGTLSPLMDTDAMSERFSRVFCPYELFSDNIKTRLKNRRYLLNMWMRTPIRRRSETNIVHELVVTFFEVFLVHTLVERSFDFIIVPLERLDDA